MVPYHELRALRDDARCLTNTARMQSIPAAALPTLGVLPDAADERPKTERKRPLGQSPQVAVLVSLRLGCGGSLCRIAYVELDRCSSPGVTRNRP